ncbi:AraC family transcriptional regulator [Actinoplanes sp. SE50]|uniref:AraC family transcriptional regulator n=1 Tax=unclassified Actinoplanes TaxID=2626549 RepID=UPI00023EC66C|nr:MULTISPECIES: AraC family transcriptional regulator [unclassified Actinoplanes]AEV85886.1 HTH-type transcriptional activator rhaR [Actinoplanes sp. SE50/110]ATO84282.1 AraC family transcriptional regulator [Actinoplanes sp. SE50]SLM01692.1 AraC family transcriptional regulator [Actinoplanes sp. SE50/110]
MDTLTGLLDGARAREAFLLRTVVQPPFALRIQDEAPLTLVTVLRGTTVVIRDEPVRLHPGDVAVIRGPEPYTVADEPDTPWQTIIHPGQVCTTVDGLPRDHLGVRSWGDATEAGTELITGTYQLAGEVSRRLLAALPGMLVQPAAATDRALVGLLTAEMGRTVPGQDLVLDRLLDLLLISVLRAWLAGPAAGAWHPAGHDPIVGPALRLLHDTPAEQWTVAGLAARTGVSRSLLARRFTDLVGEPPMAYLTGWRLSLAADRLRTSDATISAVAREVGYGSAFALSAAFKRERGLSPQEYRRQSPDRHFTAYAPSSTPLLVLA